MKQTLSPSIERRGCQQTLMLCREMKASFEIDSLFAELIVFSNCFVVSIRAPACP